MWKRILIPVDGTGIDANVTSLIAGGLAPKGSTLVLLHVIPSEAVAGAAPGRSLEVSRKIARGAQSYVAGVARKIGVRGRKASPMVAFGDPVRQILLAARKEKADLVLVGTHRRKGLDRWLTGSVADEVARKAKCPVLVLHSPGKRSASRRRS